MAEYTLKKYYPSGSVRHSVEKFHNKGVVDSHTVLFGI